MNNRDVWRIAMEQSAIDLNCTIDDFVKSGNKVVISKLNNGAKKCYKKPMFCGFAYYGDGLVASVDEQIKDFIEIDVLPEYRRLGVATTLTKILTDEIIKYGKVPFYCTAWSNIPSKNNAIKCGYKTAWVEMTAIDTNDAMEMIGEQ